LALPPPHPPSPLFPYTTLFRSLVPGPPSLNVFQRTVAVFTRPAAAWVGLESRSRWWFPMLVTVLCGVALNLLLYDRAIVQEQVRSEEHTSELQSRFDLVCRLLL